MSSTLFSRFRFFFDNYIDKLSFKHGSTGWTSVSNSSLPIEMSQSGEYFSMKFNPQFLT